MTAVESFGSQKRPAGVSQLVNRMKQFTAELQNIKPLWRNVSHPCEDCQRRFIVTCMTIPYRQTLHVTCPHCREDQRIEINQEVYSDRTATKESNDS